MLRFNQSILFAICFSILFSCTTNVDENIDEEPVKEVIQDTSATAEEVITQADTTEVVVEKPKTEKHTKTKEQKVAPVKNNPFVNRKLGKEIFEENDFDLMGYAAEDIVLLKKEHCGDNKDCGKAVQIQNYNPNKEIIAVVQIKWTTGEEKITELRQYTVKKSEVLKVGCYKTCAEDAENVSWKIVSATYKD